MSKRIKVTGYLYPAELEDGMADESHEMGLTEEGFEWYSRRLSTLDDITFELEEEE